MISNNIWLEGVDAGMTGQHYITNPFDEKTQREKHQEWKDGWASGRASLEWDNPAEISVKKVYATERGFTSYRLIPTREEIPIINWGQL